MRWRRGGQCSEMRGALVLEPDWCRNQAEEARDVQPRQNVASHAAGGSFLQGLHIIGRYS